MKKTIIASLLLATSAAFAGDVTVSGVRDLTAGKNGVRVSTEVAGLNVSATRIEDTYNRYAVGKDFNVANAGPVAISVGGAGVYQRTADGGKNGYGLTVGLKTTTPVTKNVSVVAGVERFYGQDVISQYNGNTGTLGLAVKF